LSVLEVDPFVGQQIRDAITNGVQAASVGADEGGLGCLLDGFTGAVFGASLGDALTERREFVIGRGAQGGAVFGTNE
jgi:hypothetical protein